MTAQPTAARPAHPAGSARPARSVADLAFRTYAGPADDRIVAELLRAANLFDETEMIPSDEQVANDFAHPEGLDPGRDAFIAELDGRVVAAGEVRYLMRDDRHTYMLGGAVHPDVRRLGIGSALLARLEERARERAAALPGGPVFLDSWMPDQNEGFAALIQGAGYTASRHFFEMVKADLGAVDEPSLPSGLELRPVVMADLRQVFDAEGEAFQDHWGHFEWTDEMFTRMLTEPDLDIDLWRVAWDGDEVAGVVSTWIIVGENEALGLRRGWLDHVSVRRPWRRRGVAAALILSACIALRERGMTEAALGVDSDSLTGALGLYERLGFRTIRRATTWRRTLREGPPAE
jgi:mycothiol synthase